MTWILVLWYVTGTALDGPFTEAECRAKLDETRLSSYESASRAQALLMGAGPVAAWCVQGRMAQGGG